MRIGTFPTEWVRRPELTDLDGRLAPDVLAQMRREAGAIRCPGPTTDLRWAPSTWTGRTPATCAGLDIVALRPGRVAQCSERMAISSNEVR